MKIVSGKLSGFRSCPQSKAVRVCGVAFFFTAIALLSMGSLSASNGSGKSSNTKLSIYDTHVGFSGVFAVGRWTPLTVEYRSGEPVRIVVETIDSDGSKVRFPSEWFSSEVFTKQSRTVFFQSGRLDAGIRVLLEGRSGGSRKKIVHTASDKNSSIEILKQSTNLILTLGNPLGFENQPADFIDDKSDNVKRFLPNRFRVLKLKSAKDLPTESLSYDAVHSLVLADDFNLSHEQSEALRKWVGNGGHLVLCAGSQIEKFLPGNHNASPLTEWLPTKFVRADNFSDLFGLEAFSGRTIHIRVEKNLRVGLLENPNTNEYAMGRVLANSQAGPIMIRKSYGFGKVTATGVDFTEEPLKSWSLISLVAGKMLGVERKLDSTSSAKGVGQLTNTGVTDLKSQLIGALDYFPHSRRFSAWFAMGLLIAYTIFLGPIDYFITHRVLKKPHLTWVTFPILVVAACSSTIWMAYSEKNAQIRLNKFEIVDVDATQTFAENPDQTPIRSYSWFVLSSPETQRLSLRLGEARVNGKSIFNSNSLASKDGLFPTRLISSGIPESSFGGMYRPGGLELGLPGYKLSEGSSEIPNLPISKWSTKSLAISWSRKNVSLVSSDLSSHNIGELEGSFVHQFPVPIEDWMIVFQNRVYLPLVEEGAGTSKTVIPPHVSWKIIENKLRSRGIQGFLTHTTTKTVESKSKLEISETIQEKKPYDSLSRDLLQFVRILSFHKMAGGKAYTGLVNHTLRNLEFFDARKMNQAVLIGRLRIPLSRLKIGDGDNSEVIEESKQDTFVRILLPVKSREPKVEIEKPKES